MIRMTTQSRGARGVPDLGSPLGLLLIVLLSVGLSAQQDPVEGTLDYTPEQKHEATAPEVPPLRVIELAGSGATGPAPDWQAAYHVAPNAQISAAAAATLRVALARDLGRAGAVAQLKNGGEAARPLIKTLDVGRHDILKWMYARAFVLANADLKARKMSPLRKVLTVNSGGTGDYTRDQDITAFAGDEVSEKAYFQALIAAAKELDLVVDPKETGGIDFPQIEVTLFPGGNDLPDSRFATDMGEFQLNYIKGIHKQLGDVEAYIGGGADLEVKGRRRPGQVYAQELTLGDDGAIRYAAEVPGNTRETRALFTTEPRARPEAWQKAAHIFNDLLQGYRHSLHGGDPSKGPLKYSGRAIDYLCSIQGKQPWKNLQPEERKVMLESLFPGQKVPEALLKRMEAVIDVADQVIATKRIPAGSQPELDQKIALIFLKKAVAASAGEMARQALNPPPFELSWLGAGERAGWDALTPAERHEEALKRDRTYRENFANEAYENLVVTLAMLRRIDIEEARRGNAFHGEAAIRQIIETADPRVRGVLEDASEYAKLYMELQIAPTPEAREKVRADTVEARRKLAGHLDQAETPGARILDDVARLGPRNYLERVMKGREALPAAALAVRGRFDEHMRQAFPTTAEDFRTFEQHIKANGVKSYAFDKMKAEFLQLDTVGDALTLIEMYQRGATRAEYQRFFAVNLLSRVHWSFSHLYQASQVATEADIEALGQNLVFATLSRVVPWAATAKIVFDIGKGTVNVTVGYAINVANADLVDALYTGEAGRTDTDAEGTATGALRDSGFCLLRPEHVVWIEDEKTGVKTRAIDRAEVYRYFFRQWAELDPEDVPEHRSRSGSLAKTHDDLVHILWREWANHERTWVSTDARKPIERVLEAPEVEQALRTFDEAIARHTRLAAEKVAGEAGVRQYKSYFDSEDVIVKGLADRFAADFHLGFLSWWESYMTAQMFAMREVERSAMQADCAGYGQALRESTHDAIVGEKPESPGRNPVRIKLYAEVYGRRDSDSGPFDGAEPVRVVGYIEGSGEVGERAAEVAIRVSPVSTSILIKAGKNRELIEAGDVIGQTLLVQALADQGRGPELDRVEVFVPVRMPAGAAGPQTINIRRHVERRSSGELMESFTYIERFAGMPPSWPSEDGYVFHGRREVMRFGTAKETIEYDHGLRNGLHEICDPQGRWVIRETFAGGKLDGTRTHRDPDSQARLEIDYRAGDKVAERSYADNGQILRNMTFAEESGGDEDKVVVRGTIEAFWPSGQQRFTGAYETDEIIGAYGSERGGADGETIPGRTGIWVWFHPNGKADRRATFAKGLLQGQFDAFDEGGHPLASGSYDRGLRTGAWRDGRGSGNYAEDRRQGRWDFVDEAGKRSYWETYDNGNCVESGRYDED